MQAVTSKPETSCGPTCLHTHSLTYAGSYAHARLGGFCAAGVIAIEPDVHAVAMTGSAVPLSAKPGLANGHAPPSKKPSGSIRV